MEEQYLRAARSIVKQKNITMNQEEMKVKKLKDDLRLMSFWKTRADNLEIEVNALRSKIESLEKLNRKLSTKKAMALYQKDTISSSLKDPRRNQSNTEPESIISGASRLKKALSFGQTTFLGESTEVAETEALYESDTVQAFNTGHLMKKNKILEEKVQKLSVALAQARAYPLLATSTDAVDSDLRKNRKYYGQDVSSYANSAGKYAVKAITNEFDAYDEDDFLPQHVDELAEETRQRRVQEMRKQYEERILKNRTSGSDYLQSVRRNRSFSESIRKETKSQ